MMRSHERSRRDAELALEQSREVRLIGEDGLQTATSESAEFWAPRGGGERARGGAPSCMLVRRAADGFLERAREVREREPRLASEHVEREGVGSDCASISSRTRRRTTGRETAARRLRIDAWLRPPAATILQGRARPARRVHERETGRRPGTRFRDERGEKMAAPARPAIA